jgi:cobalt-zinc-cadmium efflux system outer membrane protein
MLELRRTTLAAAEASAEYAKALHDAGNITDLDFAAERATHEQAKLDFAEAEAQLTAGRERLNALMGLWGQDTQWTVAARLPAPPEQEPALDNVESEAVERSLPLATAKQELVRAAESVRPSRRNVILDDVEAGVAAEREPGDEWSVGPAVAVPVPLFDQGQSASAIASSDLRAARERYAALAIETRAAARAAVHRLRAARERARYLRRVILPLRQEVLDETQKQYNAMQVGAFQLLQAKQAQVDAGAAYVESLRDYWLARAAVDQLAAGSAPVEVTVSRTMERASRSTDRGGH